MFTQCPNCDITFRISADVLRKAAGQVRCGGCNVAFNALDYLSEVAPTSAPPAQKNVPEPELTPETNDDASSPPKKISARRSAALMKTLDELAGSDIQLEDTGVEWLVLDDDTSDDEPDVDEEEAAKTQLDALTGSMKIVDEADKDESDDDSVEEPSTSNVMRFDDDTPLPEDLDEDDATPVIEDESTPATEETGKASGFEDPAVDLALGEPDEWEQLLDEVDESVIDSLDAMDDQLDEDSLNELPDSIDSESAQAPDADIPPDVDSQFEMQAIEMGTGLGGTHKPDEADFDNAARSDSNNGVFGDERRVEAAGTGVEEVLKRIANLDQKLDVQLDDHTDSHVDFEFDAEPGAEIEVVGAEDIFGEAEEAETAQSGTEASDDIFSEKEEAAIALLEAEASEDDDDDAVSSIDEDLIAAAFEAEKKLQGAGAAQHIPVLTEKEKTVNMMIDEDFMRHAAESGNVFSPTIDDEQVKPKSNPLFETIIMEGESIRTPQQEEALAAEAAAGLQRIDGAATASIHSGSGDYDESDEAEPASRRMIAAAVALVLLFIGQVLHQSRDALATVPAFNKTVGPVYRVAGSPLTPNWDVTGWRFEVSKGSSDDNDEMLTIYSRIGNTTDSALPYPLVHVSLTDRYEEVVGSQVLEPGQYVAGNPNPQVLVEPGKTFDAIISIESPPRDATGFKLNICYRLANKQLRCAIEDFR